MIKLEIKILIKNVIINESGHLSTFLEGQNSQIFFNMFFKNLIKFFSLNVFYNVFFKSTTHGYCKNLICNQKIHLKSDDNTKTM